jgi:hypothetical protein
MASGLLDQRHDFAIVFSSFESLVNLRHRESSQRINHRASLFVQYSTAKPRAFFVLSTSYSSDGGPFKLDACLCGHIQELLAVSQLFGDSHSVCALDHTLPVRDLRRVGRADC